MILISPSQFGPIATKEGLENLPSCLFNFKLRNETRSSLEEQWWAYRCFRTRAAFQLLRFAFAILTVATLVVTLGLLTRAAVAVLQFSVRITLQLVIL